MIAQIKTPIININQRADEFRVNFSAYFLPFTFSEVASGIFPISADTEHEELLRFKFLHLRDCYELLGQIPLAMANFAIYRGENSGLQRDVFEGATRVPINPSCQEIIVSRNPRLESIEIGMPRTPCQDIQSLVQYLHPKNVIAPTKLGRATMLTNSYDVSIGKSNFKFDPICESMFDPVFDALMKLFSNQRSLSARMPCYFEMSSTDDSHIPALSYIIQELDTQIPHYVHTCRRGRGWGMSLFNSRLYFTGKAALPEHADGKPSILPEELTKQLIA